MIDSESISVEAYYINEAKNWMLNEHKAISGILTFVSMGFDVPLSEIYNYVNL